MNFHHTIIYAKTMEEAIEKFENISSRPIFAEFNAEGE